MRWQYGLSAGAGAVCVALMLLQGGAGAQEKKEKAKGKAVNTLKVGDKAPAFSSTDDQGKAVKSSDVVGKQTLALFFFPAALTGG